MTRSEAQGEPCTLCKAPTEESESCYMGAA